MTKNQNKNDGNKQLKNVVDEQNEPCIKAIQKKLRNINKKLLEINELTIKGNLKPQQVQKVNKKDKVIEQRAKYQEFLTFYKEIVAQNSQMYKAFQYKQLTNLAQAIAFGEFSQHHTENQNQHISQLFQITTTPSSPQITLQKRVNELTQAFQGFAENNRLREFVTKGVQKNAQQQIQKVQQVVVQRVQSPKKQVEKVPEKKVQEPVVQQPKVEKQQPIQHPAQTKVPQVTALQTQVKTETVNQNAQNPTNENKPRQKKRFQNNEYKDHQKRKYKPKYVNKNQKNVEGEQAVEEDEEEEQRAVVRQFKREEVKRLYEDGFIVVGKPKIKAKGNDQKQFHDHEHGKKFHHHHKQNI